MSGIDLEARRAVRRLTKSDVSELLSPDHKHTVLKGQIEDYARSQRIGVRITSTPGKLILTKTGDLPSAVKYSEIDLLEVGQSHLFELPVSEHPAIRSSVTYRTKKTGRLYRCTAEDGALRVTRMPATAEERATCPPIETAKRQTKYAMDRLADVPEIRFDVPRIEHDKIRLSAVRASVKHGWKISCQAQADGSIIVFRPDKIAAPVSEAAQADQRQPARPTNRFDLDRLEHTREVRFAIPAIEHQALRLACHRKSARTGWTIRCRLQDDGTMLVYRTDAGAPKATAASSTAQ